MCRSIVRLSAMDILVLRGQITHRQCCCGQTRTYKYLDWTSIFLYCNYNCYVNVLHYKINLHNPSLTFSATSRVTRSFFWFFFLKNISSLVSILENNYVFRFSKLMFFNLCYVLRQYEVASSGDTATGNV